jgi:hypothetical protein
MGTKLLINENEHLNCSTIERWYPRLKDKTPFTKVYDELPPVEELEKDFSFPVFIKGNRQTNRHSRKKALLRMRINMNCCGMNGKKMKFSFGRRSLSGNMSRFK